MTQDTDLMSSPDQPTVDLGIQPEELRALLQANLSSGAVHLYCALRLAAQETGWCTRKQLMDATDVSVNKARAALDQLQQAGFLRTEKGGTAWLYAPLFPPEVPSCPAPSVEPSTPSNGQPPKTDRQPPKTDRQRAKTDRQRPFSARMEADTLYRTSSQSINQSLREEAPDFRPWLDQDTLPLLPPQPDFAPEALLQRWARAIPPTLWSRPLAVCRRVFELIHRHPHWNSPDRRVTQVDLVQLVHLATKKRPDKMRLAADPTDLLKPTPSGKARWQAILLYEALQADPPNATPERSLTQLYQARRPSSCP
jgi:hypothetical protein